MSFVQTPGVQPLPQTGVTGVTQPIQIFPQSAPAPPPQQPMMVTTRTMEGGGGGGQYFDMKKFHGLRIDIILTFFVVIVALAFLIYLAVTDTEYRNNPNTANNANYHAINLAALIFGCAGVLLMIVLVGLTAIRRYTGKNPPQYKQVGSEPTQTITQFGSPAYQQGVPVNPQGFIPQTQFNPQAQTPAPSRLPYKTKE